MRLYEGLFLFDPAEAGKGMDGIVQIVTDALTKHGAEIISVEHWGDRRLAYEVGGLRRGSYILAYFNGNPEAMSDLDRTLRLDERVIRHLVLHHEKRPAMLVERESKEKVAEAEPVGAAAE